MKKRKTNSCKKVQKKQDGIEQEEYEEDLIAKVRCTERIALQLVKSALVEA